MIIFPKPHQILILCTYSRLPGCSCREQREKLICVECGLPKGAYFYGNAKSVADAKKEAEYFISILSGKKYEYPVFYDVEPTDPLPVGKKPCLSLRELEKQIGYDLDNRLDPMGKNITVNELVERYLKTKVNVRPSTKQGYKTVQNILRKDYLQVLAYMFRFDAKKGFYFYSEMGRERRCCYVAQPWLDL